MSIDPINMVAEAVKNATLGASVKKPKAYTVESPLPDPIEETPDPIVEIEPEPVFTVTKGRKKFSELFRKTVDREHEATVYKPTDWDENIRSMIPPEIDGYVWQPELEAFHVAMETNEPVLLTGPTGCGKTSMVRNYCAVTQRPFVRMSMRGDIETSSILGMPQAKNGETIWVDGPVTQVVKSGGVVLFDEYDFTPPEIMYSIQWLLEDDPMLLLTDKSDTLKEMSVEANDRFRIVFAGNTKGQGDMTGEFPGAQVQSMATVDRCKTALNMGYLPEQDEIAIMKSHVKTITREKLDKIMQLVMLIRVAYIQGSLSIGISPRTEVSLAKKWMYWNNPRIAFELAYCNKLEENQRKIAMDAFARVFGSV